jgi:hypothetical protein
MRAKVIAPRKVHPVQKRKPHDKLDYQIEISAHGSARAEKPFH